MPLSISYTPNYYSIDDILATQERTPCKFLVTVPKLGHLNPSIEKGDLKAGTELELPSWLVLEISSGRQPIVHSELPKIYREAYREILKADASAVDLHKFSLYFYELGSYVKHFDKKNDVHDCLLHTFVHRFRQVMDLSDNIELKPLLFQRLDALERNLYKQSHLAKVRLDKWLADSSFALEAAKMVVNHKKRKRVQVEDILK